MNKIERDILDELFHEKLYDHEVDTTPGDWEMIMNRLPEPQPVVRTLRPRWIYWSAAAAVTVLVAVSLFIAKDTETPLMAGDPVEQQPVQTIIEEEKEIEIITIPEPETPMIAGPVETTTHSPVITRQVAAINQLPEHKEPERVVEPEVKNEIPVPFTEESDPVTQEKETEIIPSGINRTSTALLADNTTQSTQKNKPRRWGFGMGGGSLTSSNNNVLNYLATPTASFQEDKELLMMNTAAKSTESETDIKHKTPVSVGLSASYALNDRWSLLAGLSYSLLTTDTKQSATYHKDVKTKRHFIGLPISASYKIAEWKDLRFYGAAGFMPELNVAGKNTTKFYYKNAEGKDELRDTETEHERIKRLFWSVNARAGMSYPIIRYVNAFAEVGAAYYFDNGSDIQTIHSEKPFNVSFNFGLRLGF